MGFNVDEERRLVSVDHSHNRFCVTTPAGNPAEIIICGLKITSIFSRTKGARNGPQMGDNCPMLYALKGLHALSTSPRDIGLLSSSFRKILPVFLANGFKWDWMIPLPSSSQLCSRFADKVQKHSDHGKCHHGALNKITAADVLQAVKNLQISAKDKNALSEDIRRFIRFNTPQTAFQIKAIKRTRLRSHINPLTWGNVDAMLAPQKILLIDDMITSGTSLVCAADIIRHRYPGAQIEALTLFGSSRN